MSEPIPLYKFSVPKEQAEKMKEASIKLMVKIYFSIFIENSNIVVI